MDMIHNDLIQSLSSSCV